MLAEAADAIAGVNVVFRRTLGPLLLRPGALTEAYVTGRRDRYATPLKTYLSVNVLYFAVRGLTGDSGILGLLEYDSTLAWIDDWASQIQLLVLVPTLALLLRVLPARMTAYEAVVFTLYFLSVVALVASATAAYTWAVPAAAGSAVAGAPLVALRLWLGVYLVRGLRRVSGASWPRAVGVAVAVAYGAGLVLIGGVLAFSALG